MSQQRWISKLLGYDFVIEYKKGKENKVAYALPRRFEDPSGQEEFSISLILFPTPSWEEELKAFYLSDTKTKELLLKLQQGQLTPKGYSLQ